MTPIASTACSACATLVSFCPASYPTSKSKFQISTISAETCQRNTPRGLLPERAVVHPDPVSTKSHPLWLVVTDKGATNGRHAHFRAECVHAGSRPRNERWRPRARKKAVVLLKSWNWKNGPLFIAEPDLITDRARAAWHSCWNSFEIFVMCRRDIIKGALGVTWEEEHHFFKQNDSLGVWFGIKWLECRRKL